jgi:hypothetical protein
LCAKTHSLAGEVDSNSLTLSGKGAIDDVFRWCDRDSSTRKEICGQLADDLG